MHEQREELIDSVARCVARIERSHPVRVAIDGVDGVGKTTFADELAEPLQALGRPVIRASVDGFHNPREIRYRRGRRSPEGFFHDSFDYAALRRALLEPLGPDGSRQYRTVVFDHRSDTAVDSPTQTADGAAILLLDGLFLHRPELLQYWDISIFLRAPFEVTAARMARRDGSSPQPNAPEHRRYVEGQRLYLAACEPERVATIVIDNSVLSAPRIVERPAPPAEAPADGVVTGRGVRRARRRGVTTGQGDPEMRRNRWAEKDRRAQDESATDQ